MSEHAPDYYAPMHDSHGEPVWPEDVLDPEELADYYDRHGIPWRKR